MMLRTQKAHKNHLDQTISSYEEGLAYFFRNMDRDKMQQITEQISRCQGKLFFTGVGKSGIIAKKLAATFTSVGKGAFFLSAQDALHGDLGGVEPDDLIFILSKSGNSAEIIQLVPHLKEKKAYIVAVVNQKESKLEQICHDSFVLPFIKEACFFNVMPTISTTTQMIFGDLLALLWMNNNKLSLESFGKNHPGGQIGTMTRSKVIDLMLEKKHLPLCRSDDLLMDKLHELSEKKCGCLLITNETEELLGIFTDGDLRRAVQKYGPSALECTMQKLMQTNPRTIHPGVRASQALAAMERPSPVTVLPVIVHAKIVGIIRMHDILQIGFSK
jgi:arabinose-5-phosphate isomerase